MVEFSSAVKILLWRRIAGDERCKIGTAIVMPYGSHCSGEFSTLVRYRFRLFFFVPQPGNVFRW